MTNQNQPQPASDAAKSVIKLWNSSLNSFFITVETEDGPNAPEIIVNVRSDKQEYVASVDLDISHLVRILETATVERIPLAKNSAGEWKPTEEGQKALDESGKGSDLTFALLMTLSMVFLAPELDNLSAADLLAGLDALDQADNEPTDEEPSGSLDIRVKVIDNRDGQEIKHITINVLDNSEDEVNKLKGLQKEFVSLYKAGKITVRLKPYTQEEIEAFQKANNSAG